MRKLVFTLSIAAAGLLAMNFSFTPQDDVPSGPQIKLLKTSHNFGQIMEGPQAKTEFQYVNSGTEPLVLTRVAASCGCTTPNWSKEPLMPGDTTAVTAIYNTRGRVGPFTKSITIYSNAVNESTARVTITGTVQKQPGKETSPVRINN